MKISSWIIWMDSKSNNICPQKRKAEIDLRQTEEEKNGRGQGHIKKKKNEGRDWSNANTSCKRQKNRISPKVSGESDTLPIA